MLLHEVITQSLLLELKNEPSHIGHPDKPLLQVVQDRPFKMNSFLYEVESRNRYDLTIWDILSNKWHIENQSTTQEK